MDRYRTAQTASPGYRALLFVRDHKKTEQGITNPYTFLGPVRHVRSEGDRPVTIVWETTLPMPADFFRRVKLVS